MVSGSWCAIPSPVEPVPKMTYHSLDWVTPTADMIHASVATPAPVPWLAVVENVIVRQQNEGRAESKLTYHR